MATRLKAALMSALEALWGIPKTFHGSLFMVDDGGVHRVVMVGGWTVLTLNMLGSCCCGCCVDVQRVWGMITTG